MCVCRGGGTHLNLQILRMIHWCLLYLTTTLPLYQRCRGNAPPPILPHTTYQLSTYNTAHTVYYVLDWYVELDWYMYWAGVLDWYGQSSTYNTPVQCIQHTSPVHTTHQSSTYTTPVQYIQHTSPVHTTHHSSTYNTPVQHRMDGSLLK